MVLRSLAIRITLASFFIAAFCESSLAQRISFWPIADSIVILGLNDVPPALKLSVDTSAIGFDSVRVSSRVAMYSSLSATLRLIPYCTFVVRDSLHHDGFNLWLLRDQPATPAQIPISPEQFTGVAPGRGYLSLVISTGKQPLDSLRVRCIVDIPNAVDKIPAHKADTRLLLLPNYPNPFNGQTSIRYQLPKTEVVTIDVFNLSGQLVHRILQSVQIAGTHMVHFDAGNLPSGTYYLRLADDAHTSILTMTIIR